MPRQIIGVITDRPSIEVELTGRLSDEEADGLISHLEERHDVKTVERIEPLFGSDAYRVYLSERHLRNWTVTNAGIRLAVDRYLNY